MCVCVCVCVCGEKEREKEREREGGVCLCVSMYNNYPHKPFLCKRDTESRPAYSLPFPSSFEDIRGTVDARTGQYVHS